MGDVMSTVIRTATLDQTLEEIDHHFEVVSGLPVVDSGLICIGVVSKSDKERASNGVCSLSLSWILDGLQFEFFNDLFLLMD